jgi:hypothetical protein
VKNFGLNSETWWNHFRILDDRGMPVYEEYIQTTAAAGVEDTLMFPSMTFSTGGNFTARCSTFLATDQNWTNNLVWNAFDVIGESPWPPGWNEVSTPMPGPAPVKRGGWLARHGEVIYASKGNKTFEFYCYDPFAGTWERKADMPMGPDGKYPDKGSKGISDGERFIYATKGKNTLEYYRYDTEADTWTQLGDVPVGGGKKVKGGTDLEWVGAEKDQAGYVYLLKGYYTEFYKYNPESGEWTALASAPAGAKPKYDKGSWICVEPPGGPSPARSLFCHKAKYYNRTTYVHEFYKYDIAADTWTELAGMPLYGLHGGRIKKKKAKDGGAGAYYAAEIYALKGGNTQQFWKYNIDGDTWTEMDTMPVVGSTGRKKRVKYGADLVHWGGGAFFALKGNKTLEMWRYVVPAAMAGQQPERSGVMGGVVKAGQLGLTVAPNPLTGGYANVRYSLPKAGPASITVYDVTGRSVLKRSVLASRSGAVGIDVRSLSAGIYLVRLDADDFTATRKLVVQQ